MLYNDPGAWLICVAYGRIPALYEPARLSPESRYPSEYGVLVTPEDALPASGDDSTGDSKSPAAAAVQPTEGEGPAERVLSEECPEPARSGEGFQAGRVVTVSFGHAVHDTYTAFLAPLLPAFIAKLALSRTEAGALTVFMQGPSLLQPFIGHLADRVNLRYFVILAPAVTAAMMSMLGVAPNYAVLALLLTVVGLSSAALHAVVPVLAGRLSGRNLGRGMGFWMVGGELGRTVGPIVIVSAVTAGARITKYRRFTRSARWPMKG